MKEFFTAAWEAIKTTAVTVWNGIKNTITNIVNGIKSMICKVGDAVSSVMDKIRSFLYFSVPDEGPLTDYESWMSDLRHQYGAEYDSCWRVDGYQVKLVSDTSYGSLWEVSFTLKEFR